MATFTFVPLFPYFFSWGTEGLRIHKRSSWGFTMIDLKLYAFSFSVIKKYLVGVQWTCFHLSELKAFNYTFLVLSNAFEVSQTISLLPKWRNAPTLQTTRIFDKHLIKIWQEMTGHHFNIYRTYILLNYHIIAPLASPRQQSQTLVLLIYRKNILWNAWHVKYYEIS